MATDNIEKNNLSATAVAANRGYTVKRQAAIAAPTPWDWNLEKVDPGYIIKLLTNYFYEPLLEDAIVSRIRDGDPRMCQAFDRLCTAFFYSHYRPTWPLRHPELKIGRTPQGFARCESEIKDDTLSTVLGQLLPRGKTVLIKPNLVSPVPYPESSDPALIGAVVHALIKYEPHRIIIADGPSLFFDSRCVFEQLALSQLIAHDCVELVDIHQLTQAEFYRVPISDGLVMPDVYLPCFMDQVDILVNVCLFKAHTNTEYSGAVKNHMGLLPDFERLYLHRLSFHDFRRALADLNTIVKSDLVVMDARQILLEAQQIAYGGKPAEGFGIVLTDSDMIADIMALEMLARKEILRDATPYRQQQVTRGGGCFWETR